MDSDPETPNTPAVPSAVPAANGNPTGPEGESDSGAASLKKLQDELVHLSRELEDVRAERDELRSLVYPAIWSTFTEDELRSFAEDASMEGTQTLEQFLPELEDILNGNEGA